MKELNNQIAVLIPDGESFYLRSVLHCLSRIPRVKIYVLSTSRFTPMRFSRYVHDYHYHENKSDTEAWIQLINQQMEKYKINVLMPIFEKGICDLTNRRHLLQYPDRVLLPASNECFKTANNKAKLAYHLKEIGVPVPRSYYLEDKDVSIMDQQDLCFPMLAKPPIVSGGGEGIETVNNREELRKKIELGAIVPPVLLQEHLQGHDLGCNVICKEGKILAYTIQKGFLYNNVPFSPQIGLTMIEETTVLASVTRLMSSLNWNGVANVDLYYDEKHKEYKVLEINPRYWNTLLGSLVAGVNFPKIYCDTVLGKVTEPTKYQHKDFLNLKGAYRSITRDYRILLRPTYLWRHTPLPYIVKDPIPVLYQFIWRSKNKLYRKFKSGSAA